MRKLILAAWLVCFTLPLATCGKAGDARFAKETTVIYIFEPKPEEGDTVELPKCKMVDQTVAPLFTQRGRTVTWVISGTCLNSTIRIGKEFTVRGGRGTQEIMAPGRGSIEGPAKDGEKLTIEVSPRAPDGTYEYQIFIDNKPAEYASPADRGVLAVCPDWPCRVRG